MEELIKKIELLLDLVKAVKQPISAGPKAPSLPKISPPPPPSMTASNPSKAPGVNPDSKKDPKKIAEQIKSGAIRKPTLIKFDKNGQWDLD